MVLFDHIQSSAEVIPLTTPRGFGMAILPRADRRDDSHLVSRLDHLVGILLYIDIFAFKTNSTAAQDLVTDPRVPLLKQRVQLGQRQGRGKTLGVFGGELRRGREVVDSEFPC